MKYEQSNYEGRQRFLTCDLNQIVIIAFPKTQRYSKQICNKFLIKLNYRKRYNTFNGKEQTVA